MVTAKVDRLQEIPCVSIPREGPFSDELVHTVLRGLEDIGFLYVYAPHVSQMLQFVYNQYRLFFDLPLKVKQKYMFPEIMYERGYTPLYQETGLFCKALGPNHGPMPDKKECYMMGPLAVPEDPELRQKWHKFNLENIWPAEVVDFRNAMELLYTSMYPLGIDVLKVLEVGLRKPTGFFEEMVRDGPSVMRAIHYPPMQPDDIGRVVPGCAHTDINLVTVLPKSTQSGLWIRLRRSKKYIPAKAPEGYLIVQSGDMLRVVTRGRIASAIHEIRSPVPDTGVGRLSSALFIHPRSDVRLDAKRTAGQYLEERLHELGLY